MSLAGVNPSIHDMFQPRHTTQQQLKNQTGPAGIVLLFPISQSGPRRREHFRTDDVGSNIHSPIHPSRFVLTFACKWPCSYQLFAFAPIATTHPQWLHNNPVRCVLQWCASPPARFDSLKSVWKHSKKPFSSLVKSSLFSRISSDKTCFSG